ncbi:MAG: phosphate-binding protein [Chlorobium sp.]|nr:MAG: phosphate-binding protein [Chlorobium sp.]
MNLLIPITNNSCHRLPFKVMNALLPLFLILLLQGCSKRRVDETARSGQMTLAVDRQLADIADSQLKIFSGYYPDAHISLMPVSSNQSLKLLLDRRVRGALIGGMPDAAEEALFGTPSSSLRREAVAHDAIVCMVNSRSPLRSISLEELKNLFTGQDGRGMTALVMADDFSLQSHFAATTGIKRGEIRAWGCSSDSALIRRIAADKSAVGLLFHSSPEVRRVSESATSSIKILPLAKKSKDAVALFPTQQTIFDGSYPLVTTVYYLYFSEDPLATGLGAWLGSGGQKAFERSSLAPFKLVERTIILN